MAARPGVVVIGTGFGARVHVPALREAGFEVTALVGRDPARTRRRAEALGLTPAFDIDEAVHMPGVVAATVATPPATHAAVCSQVLAAGRHVLCEKPFTLDATQARQLVEAAAREGVAGVVGHEFRFAVERALMQRLVVRGALGTPKLATLISWTALAADANARLPRWWFDPTAGGGWLGASGSHLVDQMRCWLGEPRWVSAVLTSVADRPAQSAEDSFSVLVGMDAGAVAVLQQSAACHGPGMVEARVAGSAGTAWIEGGEVWLADREGSRVVKVPEELRLPPGPPPSDDPRLRFSHLEIPPYVRLVDAWRRLIEGVPLRPGPVPASFSEGLAGMRVMDAIRCSAQRSGERIGVDTQ